MKAGPRPSQGFPQVPRPTLRAMEACREESGVMVRILVADDHDVVRSGVRTIL